MYKSDGAYKIYVKEAIKLMKESKEWLKKWKGTSSLLIFRVNSIPIQVSTSYFVNINKLILKFK
jgi:hypothetical protein